MSQTQTTAGGTIGIAAALAALVGATVFGYGLLLVPQSALGGGWIAAGGLSLALSGLFATAWVGDRFGLSAGTRQQLSLACLGVAAFLLVAFVLINGATFESGSVTESN